MQFGLGYHEFFVSKTNPNMCVFNLFLSFGLVEVQPEDVSSIFLINGTLMNVHPFPVDPLPY